MRSLLYNFCKPGTSGALGAGAVGYFLWEKYVQTMVITLYTIRYLYNLELHKRTYSLFYYFVKITNKFIILRVTWKLETQKEKALFWMNSFFLEYKTQPEYKQSSGQFHLLTFKFINMYVM